MIEKLVQFFVGVIDAQLFERIDGEIFETEYIEDAEKSGRILAGVRTRIDVVYQPRESSRIQRFGHGVSVFDCLKKYKYIIQIVQKKVNKIK